LKIKDQEHKDNIRVAVLNKQLDLMWKQAQYVSTVEAGSLVAWYVFKDESIVLASFTLLFSIILIGIMFLTMRRYAILVNRYSKMLKHIIYPSEQEIKLEPNLYIDDQALTSHLLLRFIPFFLIITNVFLILTMWVEYIYYFEIIKYNLPYLSVLSITSAQVVLFFLIGKPNYLLAAIFISAIFTIILKFQWVKKVLYEPK